MERMAGYYFAKISGTVFGGVCCGPPTQSRVVGLWLRLESSMGFSRANTIGVQIRLGVLSLVKLVMLNTWRTIEKMSSGVLRTAC